MHRTIAGYHLTLDSAKPAAKPPPGSALLREATVHLAQTRLLVERSIRATPHPNADQLRLLSRWLGKGVEWLERQSRE